MNVNPAYRTSELAYALRQSGCRVLVAAPEFKGSDYGAMVEEARGDLPELAHVILFDSPEWDALAGGEGGPAEAELRTRMDELDFDDPINIQYTSGTYRPPEGRHAHPLLRHGDWQSGMQRGRGLHRLSRGGLRPFGDA